MIGSNKTKDEKKLRVTKLKSNRVWLLIEENCLVVVDKSFDSFLGRHPNLYCFVGFL